jgi:hypothetical protein
MCSALDSAARATQLHAPHHDLLDRTANQNAGLSALLATGQGAQCLAPHIAPASLDTIQIAAANDPDVTANWQTALTQLAARTYTANQIL